MTVGSTPGEQSGSLKGLVVEVLVHAHILVHVAERYLKDRVLEESKLNTTLDKNINIMNIMYLYLSQTPSGNSYVTSGIFR